MNKVFLFTSNYPFANGEEFITAEIKYLEQYFDICIIPCSPLGNLITRNNDLKVKLDLLAENNFKNLCLTLLSSLCEKKFYVYFMQEIIVGKQLRLKSIARCMSQYIKAKIYAKQINKLIKDQQDQNVIFYNYWLDFPVLAFDFIDKPQNCRLVSRAHGVDIFADQNKHGYVPFLLKKINLLDKLFLVSEHANDYLLHQFGNKIKKNITISKLGIEKFYPETTSFYSGDNSVYKFISVSGLISVKRVELIIDLIAAIKTLGINIEWHHIGDGDLAQKIHGYAHEKLSDNYFFCGYKTNKEVHEILKQSNFAVFISCSESEGLPVSMQEAQAYGLPIIATNVGGVAEVLADFDCGWLIEKNFNINSVATMVACDLQNIDMMKKMSENAYKSYLRKYQAKNNYESFCKSLECLFE